MNKVKLLLKQISIPAKEGYEYQVIETSDARYICGEILDRPYVKEMCRKQNVKIILG